MQTASGSGERCQRRLHNMVTKSGGNPLVDRQQFLFMNDGLQGTNVDDALRTRP